MKKILLGIIIGIVIGVLYEAKIKRLYNKYAPKTEITSLYNKIKPE
jgi:small basic protein